MPQEQNTKYLSCLVSILDLSSLITPLAASYLPRLTTKTTCHMMIFNWTSVFWPLLVLFVCFSNNHTLSVMWSLPTPTICRQSMLWRPATFTVGLPWGDFSHKAALTRRQMYMSKCQHCHSEKILPITCHSKAIFLTAWLLILLLRSSGWSSSVCLRGYPPT